MRSLFDHVVERRKLGIRRNTVDSLLRRHSMSSSRNLRGVDDIKTSRPQWNHLSTPHIIVRYFFQNTATEVMKPQQRCQPLKIAMCKSLNYTHTILPNFLNHTNQAAVSRILNTKEFKTQLESNCSAQLKRFACFLFAPFCTSDGTPLPPCQRFCEKVKTDCANLTARWLADLDCTRFPTLSRKRLCFGDPLTTIDCVGRHSRPCTGSTFCCCCCSFFVACPLTSA